MSTTTPTFTLNNGVIMPALGLGVFQSPPADTVRAVEAAIGSGYRMIDTAAAYGNERQVGDGIRRSGLDRAAVFVETKVWVSDYGYNQTLHAFDKAIRNGSARANADGHPLRGSFYLHPSRVPLDQAVLRPRSRRVDGPGCGPWTCPHTPPVDPHDAGDLQPTASPAATNAADRPVVAPSPPVPARTSAPTPTPVPTGDGRREVA